MYFLTLIFTTIIKIFWRGSGNGWHPITTLYNAIRELRQSLYCVLSLHIQLSWEGLPMLYRLETTSPNHGQLT